MSRKYRKYQSKTFDEMYVIDPDTGCWSWQGHVHVNGLPIWKGWYSALQVAWEKVKGPLAGRRIKRRSQICIEKRCINPMHMIERSRKHDENQSGADADGMGLYGIEARNMWTAGSRRNYRS